MKKLRGFSTAAVVGVVLGLAVVALMVISIVNNQPIDHCYIREPNETTGQMEENIKGPKDAPIIVYEYADFQCEYCAMLNPYVVGAIKVAEGNLAVVYRSYVAPYHQYGQQSAAAANAAAAQGYFEDFANNLFAKQEEWAYGTEAKFNEYMEKYFKEVTDGKGDLDKFNADRVAENIATKINNETELAKRAKINGTPAFYYKNQLIDFSNQNGGSIKVAGEKLSWDHALSGDEFAQVLLDIVNISRYKNGENNENTENDENTTENMTEGWVPIPE